MDTESNVTKSSDMDFADLIPGWKDTGGILKTSVHKKTPPFLMRSLRYKMKD
jgi:hypothetical protein